MSLDISSTFDRARDEQSFIDAREAQFVHDEGTKETPSSSVILGADGQARASAEIAKADQKRQRDNADTQILLAVQRRLDGLYEARDIANEELIGIRENKAALESLEQMYEDGTLDPDSEEHQKVMAKAGISREDLMKDPKGAFERQEEFWEARERNKIKEIEDIDKDIDRTEKITQAPPEQQKALLLAAEQDVSDSTFVSSNIQQDLVTEVLATKNYSHDGLSFQANAAQENMFSNGGFGSDQKASEFSTNKSFASTIDVGNPPVMLKLSAEFDAAVNMESPSSEFPVLDLSAGFKM